MQTSLLIKFMIIAGLALLLLIPLVLIGGVITERQEYRAGVIYDIAQSSAGSQTVSGLILVAPYKETVTKQEDIYEDGKRKTITKQVVVQKRKYFLPDTLHIKGKLNTSERYRGIYTVPTYQAALQFTGEFNIPASLGLTSDTSKIEWQTPFVMMPVSDIRGINGQIAASMNSKQAEVVPGTASELFASGVRMELSSITDFSAAQRIAFDVSMGLDGMERLEFLPTGKYTEVSLDSPWQHPSFMGRYLPKHREVSERGFQAQWETSFFASNMQQHLATCISTQSCLDFDANRFGVELHDGVDIYVQADRSIKYAILFVGLTFVMFFLFEVLKDMRIHPVQYGLVGMALAVFYLLLVSLSEHIAFHLAYLSASAASVLLLSFYVSYVLRSKANGLLFGGLLSGLYGALFLLIRSEDYALLMGSSLIFAVLACIMVITRKVDWHSIGRKPQATTPKVEA